MERATSAARDARPAIPLRVEVLEERVVAYSANNLLTQVKHYDSSASRVLTKDYKYDAFGEMVDSSVSGGLTARFAIDGFNSNMAAGVGNENMNVWGVLETRGTLTNRYLWSNEVDGKLGRIDIVGGVYQAYYAIQDRLNSIRDVIDASGVLKDSIKYDGFGKIQAGELDPTYRGKKRGRGQFVGKKKGRGQFRRKTD